MLQKVIDLTGCKNLNFAWILVFELLCYRCTEFDGINKIEK